MRNEKELVIRARKLIKEFHECKDEKKAKKILNEILLITSEVVMESNRE